MWRLQSFLYSRFSNMTLIQRETTLQWFQTNLKDQLHNNDTWVCTWKGHTVHTIQDMKTYQSSSCEYLFVDLKKEFLLQIQTDQIYLYLNNSKGKLRVMTCKTWRWRILSIWHIYFVSYACCSGLSVVMVRDRRATRENNWLEIITYRTNAASSQPNSFLPFYFQLASRLAVRLFRRPSYQS